MLRVVIVDDEQPAIDILTILLRGTGRVEVIGAYTKPSEALKNIGRLKADAVFLDVEMPCINGLELATYLLNQDTGLEIVFLTAFPRYAVEAFALNATDYLLKPALPENVDRAVSRLLKHARTRFFSVKQGGKICSFGKFELRRLPENSVIKWRTAKTEELFAYLLYYRETIVSKEKIIDHLWPALETADTHLHTSVYRVKKTLKENGVDISIQFVGGGYILQIGKDVTYDVNEIDYFIGNGKIINSDTVKEFEKIAALYQGDYLESKDYPWCVAERSRLQKNYVGLVKQIAMYYTVEREYAKAEEVILQIMAYLSYDEDAYELLLQVLFLQNDRVGVIKYYEQLKNVLSKELGIEPGPSLKRLYEKVMNE